MNKSQNLLPLAFFAIVTTGTAILGVLSAVQYTGDPISQWHRPVLVGSGLVLGITSAVYAVSGHPKGDVFGVIAAIAGPAFAWRMCQLLAQSNTLAPTLPWLYGPIAAAIAVGISLAPFLWITAIKEWRQRVQEQIENRIVG